MRRANPQLKAFLLLLLMPFTLSGCITINPGGGEKPPAAIPSPPALLPTVQPALPELTDERLMNAEYLSALLQVPVSLVDGAFSGVVAGSELNVRLQPGIAYGDLNADGINDAAMILSENTGGSGVFTSLLVVYSKDKQFAQALGVMIDDRPVINSLTVENGVLKLGALVHAPNDPMVNPTTSMSAEYTLFGGRLVQTRLTSAFGGSGEHAIYIDSPVEGDIVRGSVRVTGSMPIGPFENNLSLLISDPLSGQLAHEGFMVQAADMGAPATFDNSVALPDVPAGTQILLVLSELSMADGTPLAVDSVVLVVGE